VKGASGARYIPLPFIDRMDLAYSAADLVVARAGAMSVAEISTVGIPAIFVPLPTGNGEQKRNARKLIDKGAAREIESSHFGPAVVTREILPLIVNVQELAKMESAMKSENSPNAATELARWGLSCS